MTVELTKWDLVNLVMGLYVDYEFISELEERKLGWYSASYSRWNWDKSELSFLTEQELWELYNHVNI